MMEFVRALQAVSNRTFQQDFEVPSMVSRFAQTQRFGHTRDFTRLFSSDSTEAQDYVKGLVLSAIFLLSLLASWVILIIIFRCLGPRRVGFLSGAPFQRIVDENRALVLASRGGDVEQKSTELAAEIAARNNTNANNSSLDYYHEAISISKRPTRVRIVFLLAGAVFITFAILSVTNGLTKLQSTVDNVAVNADTIDQLAKEAEAILGAVKQIRASAITVRNTLSAELEAGSFCPADGAIGTSPIAIDVTQQAEEAVPILISLENFVSENVDDLQGASTDVQLTTQSVMEETDKIQLTSWQALIILVPFTLIPALLMAGVIMAMFDVQSPYFACALNWFIFPVFFVMVVFMGIGASAMLMGASANADFCLPGGRSDATVDDNILTIIQEQGVVSESMEFRVASFYISQCRILDDPFDFITEFKPKLEDTRVALQSLKEQLADNSLLAELELFCNREYRSIKLLIGNMLELTDLILDAFLRTLALADCATIVPIYTSVFYDGTCTYSMAAVMWVFSGFLITAVFGLIMITTRSAYKATIYRTPVDAEAHSEKSRGATKGHDDDDAGDVVEEVEPHVALSPARRNEVQEDYGIAQKPQGLKHQASPY